ncbi:MAG: helix-turn-helix domain-containing protein [Planctomycetota bacterium]
MRPPTLDITDPEVWKLLMSPVRIEIAESLASFGPCSVREVAEFLDRPADTLYRHIGLLEGAGLVVDAGVRRGARNSERLIDLAADDFRPAFDAPGGEGEREAIVRTVDTVTKTTQRMVRELGERERFRLDDGDRNIVISWEIGWLSPDDVHEAHAIIRRLKELMDRGKDEREGRPFVSLSLLSEISHRRGAASRTRASDTTDSRDTRTTNDTSRNGARAGTTSTKDNG